MISLLYLSTGALTGSAIPNRHEIAERFFPAVPWVVLVVPLGILIIVTYGMRYCYKSGGLSFRMGLYGYETVNKIIPTEPLRGLRGVMI